MEWYIMELQLYQKMLNYLQNILLIFTSKRQFLLFHFLINTWNCQKLPFAGAVGKQWFSVVVLICISLLANELIMSSFLVFGFLKSLFKLCTYFLSSRLFVFLRVVMCIIWNKDLKRWGSYGNNERRSFQVVKRFSAKILCQKSVWSEKINSRWIEGNGRRSSRKLWPGLRMKWGTTAVFRAEEWHNLTLPF